MAEMVGFFFFSKSRMTSLFCLSSCLYASNRMCANGSLGIWINMEDHLKLVSSRSDANIQEAFASVCINLVKVRLG